MDLIEELGDVGNFHFKPYERDLQSSCVARYMTECNTPDMYGETLNLTIMHWNIVSSHYIFNEKMDDLAPVTQF